MREGPRNGLASVVTMPPGLAHEAGLHVVYVRRKQARGLVALHRERGHPERLACASVGESELLHSGVQARATLCWFPDDPAIPGLAPCWEPQRHRRVWDLLERAACRSAAAEGRLLTVRTEPLRYKPRDRCVLRQRLVLERAPSARAEVSVIAKAYRQRERATRVHAIAAELNARTAGIVPRALGALEALGIVLFEDVGSPPSVAAGQALRPSAHSVFPDHELRATATALAALHACPVGPLCESRPAARDAAQVHERTDLLARWMPSRGDRLRRAGRLIADALRNAPPGEASLVHGSFKPSQLLFCEHERVVVTDLDNCCAADPALDIGYFLAYLRPAALWRGSAAARAWYGRAAMCFCEAYVAAAGTAGTAGASGDAERALARAPAYEAAALVKIAARRVHRLNSPRPHELDAILDAAVTRIDDSAERRG